MSVLKADGRVNRMKRVRLSTLILVIVVLALGLAFVIQQGRDRARLRDALVALRDARFQLLQLKAQEYRQLRRVVPDRNDSRIKAAAAELEKLRSDYNADLDRLRATAR